MKAVRLIFASAIIPAIIEGLYFYPVIPDCMAVHFNASGTADVWGSKTHFFLTFGVMITMMAVLFGGLGALIRRLPDALITLPNKDYWLAPERREQTHERISDQLLIIGSLTLLLMDGILYLSLSANLRGGPAISAEWLWGMIIVFIIINIVWTVNILRSFRRPVP
jgi:uncharacterized membrane protein